MIVFILLSALVNSFFPAPTSNPAQVTSVPVVQKAAVSTISPTDSPTPTFTVTPTITYKLTPTIVRKISTPTPTKYIAPTATPTPIPQSTGLSNDNSYVNSAGNEVHSPAYSNSVPAGATAVCGDGTYSFSQSHSGTCSHHGGVSQWL